MTVEACNANVALSNPIPLHRTLSQSSATDLQQKTAQLFKNTVFSQGFAHCTVAGQKMRMCLIHKNPPIIWINNFVSSEEADQIVKDSEPKKRRSGVGNPPHASSLVGSRGISEWRTSSTSWYARNAPLAQPIESRMMALAGVGIDHIEPLQYTSYEPGQYYLDHYDTKPSDKQLTLDGGWRVFTFLTYLNDVPKGGETVFAKLQLSIAPKKGCAIWWSNLYKNPENQQVTVDARTLHAGKPPESGSKSVVNGWVRQGRFVHGSNGLSAIENSSTQESSPVALGESYMEKIADALAKG